MSTTLPLLPLSFEFFPPKTAEGMEKLSATRAALAVLQGRAVNVLVLDEPTNHLDAAAIDQLQEALLAFDGTLFIVTHDRALLDALAPSVVWRFSRSEQVGSVRPDA